MGLTVKSSDEPMPENFLESIEDADSSSENDEYNSEDAANDGFYWDYRITVQERLAEFIEECMAKPDNRFGKKGAKTWRWEGATMT